MFFSGILAKYKVGAIQCVSSLQGSHSICKTSILMHPIHEFFYVYKYASHRCFGAMLTINRSVGVALEDEQTSWNFVSTKKEES